MEYRESRNIEASIIDYIKDALQAANWSGISVEKSFQRIYSIPVNTFQSSGAVCVRMEDTDHLSIEIGTNSTHRVTQVLVDIFGANDGQRLDLKDFLVSILKTGKLIPYFEYEIEGSSVSDKTQDGNMRVSAIADTLVKLADDKSLLAVHDRYRHLLSLTIDLGRVEE